MATIWYQLVTADGKPVPEITADKVSLPNANSDVADLRKEVREECPLHLGEYDANQLLVYASKSERDVDIAASKTLTGLKPGKKVDTLPETNDDNPLLIVVPPPPVSPLSPLSSLSSLSSEERRPSKNRKRRWDALNKIIKKNKKVKNNSDGTFTTAYSSVTWNDVKEVFEDGMVRMVLIPKPVSSKTLDWVYETLCINTSAFGGLESGKEAKRLYFIAPILAGVCLEFSGDLKILVEEVTDGENIHVSERFDFVLQRGKTKVCIVEAKKEDFDQGQAQDLLGCEALADVENLNCVYGIVTNYLNWHFLKSRDDNIERSISTLALEPTGLPKRISVGEIVGTICTLLSE